MAASPTPTALLRMTLMRRGWPWSDCRSWSGNLPPAATGFAPEGSEQGAGQGQIQPSTPHPYQNASKAVLGRRPKRFPLALPQSMQGDEEATQLARNVSGKGRSGCRYACFEPCRPLFLWGDK